MIPADRTRATSSRRATQGASSRAVNGYPIVADDGWTTVGNVNDQASSDDGWKTIGNIGDKQSPDDGWKTVGNVNDRWETVGNVSDKAPFPMAASHTNVMLPQPLPSDRVSTYTPPRPSGNVIDTSKPLLTVSDRLNEEMPDTTTLPPAPVAPGVPLYAGANQN